MFEQQGTPRLTGTDKQKSKLKNAFSVQMRKSEQGRTFDVWLANVPQIVDAFDSHAMPDITVLLVQEFRKGLKGPSMSPLRYIYSVSRAQDIASPRMDYEPMENGASETSPDAEAANLAYKLQMVKELENVLTPMEKLILSKNRNSQLDWEDG